METKNINRELNKLIPLAEELSEMEVPVWGIVSAGFPSEAYNYIETGIDFNKYLVKHKESTFCLKAGGDSMKGDGIFIGDLLVVDRLEEPYENSILILSINGENTMKRLRYGKGVIELVSSNPEQPIITVHEGEEVFRWGVVKHAIKNF